MNGTVIHEIVEAPKPTGTDLTRNEAPRGPLPLQGNHRSEYRDHPAD